MPLPRPRLDPGSDEGTDVIKNENATNAAAAEPAAAPLDFHVGLPRKFRAPAVETSDEEEEGPDEVFYPGTTGPRCTRGEKEKNTSVPGTPSSTVGPPLYTGITPLVPAMNIQHADHRLTPSLAEAPVLILADNPTTGKSDNNLQTPISGWHGSSSQLPVLSLIHI